MTSFSVLMSVYHKEKPTFFDSALKSILIEQTLKPTEFVLICDGELTPQLEVIISKYLDLFPGILKVYRKENGWLGKALNFGLPKCSYELIARADNDDICKPYRFEKQVKLMEEHPEYGLISSWIDEFENEPGDSQLSRILPETPEDVLLYSKSRCPVNHP